MQQRHKLLLRFVIGYSQDADEMLALDAEASNHGGFVRLAVEVRCCGVPCSALGSMLLLLARCWYDVTQERYSSLTLKTFLFLRTAISRYDVQYVIKADDDIYLNPPRLALAIPQWHAMQRGTPIVCHTHALFGIRKCTIV